MTRDYNEYEYYTIAIKKGSPLHELILREAESKRESRIAPMLRDRIERSYEHDGLVDRIVSKLESMTIITQQSTVTSEEPSQDNVDDALDVWE